MSAFNCTLRREEQAVFALRGLYEGYGYAPYKMSKFEEYDLYVRNKEFLISDGVITFTDTDGKLMALKPDVTLSIIKNSRDEAGCVQKVYYNENVYRVSEDAHCFKEILQTGLECMGDIDAACVYEVVLLAAESLRRVAPKAVLDLSHLGVIDGLLEGLSADVRGAICHCIGEKNAHELKAVCAEYGVAEDVAEKLQKLVGLYGAPTKVIPALKALIGDTEAVTALEKLTAALTEGGYDDMLRIDFSVVDEGSYYNGIVFRGFAEGVPDSVLSGGQYDRLMRQMGRRGGAVGFAVYLDRLGRMPEAAKEYDVDTLLLYDEGCNLTALYAAADSLRKEGSVMLQKEIPAKLTYRQAYRFVNGEVTPV
ncbi:MAG: ATP phosphoribosyltransferase regulatory subunit [Clostridia bacterium]|nr:ATP phosphoribosyltransferase regulatory subunit [Clostridia bacterium]